MERGGRSIVLGDIWEGFLEGVIPFKDRTLTIRGTSARSHVLEKGRNMSLALSLMAKHVTWSVTDSVATSSPLCLAAFTTIVA